MSEPMKEESFVSHLVELRSRLMKAVGAILLVVIVLMIWPGSAKIYNFVAAPLMASLPKGGTMIATDVIVASWLSGRIAVCALSNVGLHRARFVFAREKARDADHRVVDAAFFRGDGVCVLHRIPVAVPDTFQLRA
jgi:hypothetical protein